MKNMNNIKKISGKLFSNGLLFMLCTYILLCSFIVLVGCQLVLEHKKTILKEANIAFIEAIRKEKEQSIKIVSFQYDFRLSPNSIPGEEKKNWSDQMYLTIEDPNRHCLDSIFYAELVKRNIPALVALQCKIGDKVTASRTDDFFKKAIKLDTISYRKDYGNNSKVTLCPYIHLSYWWLLDCWYIYIFLVVWSFCSIVFVNRLREKERRKITEQLVTDINVMPTENKPYKPKFKIQWTNLPGNFFLDEKCGILKHGSKQIRLSGDSLTYFLNFIWKENFMLTYQEIFVQIYGIKREKFSKTDRSRIAHGIERLQKQLKDFENIKITLIWGKGYQLVIDE